VAERRLGQDEQYFTVREILAEASRVADAVLSSERSDFYRFGFAALGLTSFHPEPKISGWSCQCSAVSFNYWIYLDLAEN